MKTDIEVDSLTKIELIWKRGDCKSLSNNGCLVDVKDVSVFFKLPIPGLDDEHRCLRFENKYLKKF